MKVRLCWSVTTTSGDGPYGIEMQIPVKENVSIEKLDAIIDKATLLTNLGLDDIIAPESMTLVTPEEFDEQFPDAEEVCDV